MHRAPLYEMATKRTPTSVHIAILTKVRIHWRSAATPNAALFPSTLRQWMLNQVQHDGFSGLTSPA
jgi:hypothetical protein